MWRSSLLLALLLAACSKGPQADLSAIKEARSLAAEWALVNEQATQGKLTATYVDTMHQTLREQLETASAALTVPDAPYGQEIRAILKQPDNSAPAALRVHVARLKQMEDQLESA